MPDLESQELDELAAWARGKTPRRVIARELEDPRDEAVVAAVFAGQRVAGEPWFVRGVLRRRDDGAPMLRRVAIEHFDDPSREVTSTLLRDINLGRIRDEAMRRLRVRGDILGRFADAGRVPQATAAAARRAAAEAAKGKRGAHGALARDHYRFVAIKYLELVGEGRRDIVNALCEELSEVMREPVEYERVREWIKKATKLGFLSPGQRGPYGRLPGPRLNPKEKR